MKPSVLLQVARILLLTPFITASPTADLDFGAPSVIDSDGSLDSTETPFIDTYESLNDTEVDTSEVVKWHVRSYSNEKCMESPYKTVPGFSYARTCSKFTNFYSMDGKKHRYPASVKFERYNSPNCRLKLFWAFSHTKCKPEKEIQWAGLGCFEIPGVENAKNRQMTWSVHCDNYGGE
ncbi:hypothetical protein BJ170DRAFT_677821 [Xylariales sp. AK1849]|nr:hypothetical protein BJ170DRAFT_677821 [Xylariales sp. AK1849]